MIISYAQNFEDVMLWRALAHIDKGFYIDVGAAWPDMHSVTRVFYERGWHGINIEPNPDFFANLSEKRPHDINLQLAISDAPGTLWMNFVVDTGLSTLDNSIAQRHMDVGWSIDRHRVDVATLANIWQMHVLPSQDVHFLKIDVEGVEAAVLRGNDWKKCRPWIVIVEATLPLSQIENHEYFEAILLEAGYIFAYADGLNRFYIANEHPELLTAFRYPPNVFDDFKLSNLHETELRAQAAESRTDQVELRAQQAEVRVQQSEARAQQAEDSAMELQAELEVVRGELHNVHQSNHHHWTLAEARQKRIEDLLNSDSWRITAPLRWMGHQARLLRQHGPVSRLNALAKKIARSIIRRSIAFISTRPTLRYRCVTVARKLGLYNLLRSVYWRFSSSPQSFSGQALFQQGDSGESRKNFPSSAYLTADNFAHITRKYQKENTDVIALPLPVGKRIIYLFVDHTIQCPTNTGVQRVVRGMASSLLQRGECVRYVKWDFDSARCVFINASEREHLSCWNGPLVDAQDRGIYPTPNQSQILVTPHLLGENNWLIVPEVTHITYQPRPITKDVLLWARGAGLKTGFVFYDAIPLRRKELHDMFARHADYMQQLLLADVVWPISEWSAKDILSYWVEHEHADNSTLPEIQAIPLPGESTVSGRVKSAEPGETLILSVGTIVPHKNQIQLIHAFESYRKKHPKSSWRLILVGNISPVLVDEVKRATDQDAAITHWGHVSEKELDKLYRSCAFSVFPSVEEGFGLPILESLWYGKPCICADFGAMAEVAESGGCLTVNTRDHAELERSITRMISDQSLRDRLARQAVTLPIKTWAEYAETICARIDREGRASDRVGVVYYWIDATLQFPKNTGIQRVSRQLARAMMEIGTNLIPVKWDDNLRQFCPVDKDELEFFSQWNGPAASMWHDWVVPSAIGQKSWFFMPDLPLNRTTNERKQLMHFVREMNMHCAAIFYDAIPWKMRNIYPEHFATAHKEYMIGLGEYDLVLPISSYSCDDLVDFLGAELPRPQSLEYNIKTVMLPGEFAENTRVTQYTVRVEDPIKVLCVGTVEPRKNHETLLKAFALVTQKSKADIQLIIVGGSHSIDPTLPDRVHSFISNHVGIAWEENADDTRLRELQMECDFTVYPSIEEGFGLPILESLWYAKPCICANFGAMYEVAKGGGCVTVDVRDAGALAEAIRQVAEDVTLRTRLSQEAVNRPFASWQDYAREITTRLAQAFPHALPRNIELSREEIAVRALAMHLSARPKLSVCISTFNRAEWLSASLKNWSRLYPEPLPGVELFVCDNTSTDHTPEVVKPYLSRVDVSYHRNDRNVGMLGNLRETAHHANGEYVWILGDDDLLMPGSIERVLDALHSHPGGALVYLNYAYTRIEDARTVKDFDAFFREATPIVPAEGDRVGPIRTICARNENFFTAIYTLVFRRDHAMNAYSQNTSGRPFSTMLTCIPTTYYVLNYMMEELGVWIGSPQLVVNMNVSWLRYAPLWILERIPELYELAERKGVPADDMDRWRRHTLPAVTHYFREIFENDPLNNAAYFEPSRLVRRFKHLSEFEAVVPTLVGIYENAHAVGHPVAALPRECVFSCLS